LEAVLGYRKRIEESKSAALARVVAARLQAEAALQAVLDEQARTIRMLGELQASGTFTASDLEDHAFYIHALQGQEVQRRRHLAGERANEEGARAELVTARQDREILDRLKQNQHLAYLKELDAADAKLSDELATEAYARRIAGT
jgi:flagellar export protein FliJ